MRLESVSGQELGPIDYIKTENAGFVSTNENEIYAVLDEITKDPNIVSQRAAFAFECGRRNHSKEIVMKKLNEIINSPVGVGGGKILIFNQMHNELYGQYSLNIAL